MSFLKRSSATTALGILVALALGAGCQSAAPSSATPPPQQAVLLTTGNGTTSVVLPRSDGGVTYLSSAKTDHCAQCESDVAAYFKGGALAPKCTVCGATRTT